MDIRPPSISRTVSVKFNYDDEHIRKILQTVNHVAPFLSILSSLVLPISNKKCRGQGLKGTAGCEYVTLRNQRDVGWPEKLRMGGGGLGRAVPVEHACALRVPDRGGEPDGE